MKNAIKKLYKELSTREGYAFNDMHRYFNPLWVDSRFNTSILEEEMLKALLQIKDGNFGEFDDLSSCKMNLSYVSQDGTEMSDMIHFLNDFHKVEYLENKRLLNRD